MSYDEHDAAMDDFYDRMSEELYPEHKEQAIDEFIEERMHSYYLQAPNLIQPPIDCYNHANNLLEISPQCALVMYTTAIELFLKSVLLKPVLFGMIHNKNIANLIVDSTTSQSGFSRYNKLLSTLCLHAAGTKLEDIKGMNGKPILVEAEEVQKIRNRVVHQGYMASVEEMGKARNIASLILTEVVEPVLNNMNLVIGKRNGKHAVIKA
jgi:hypothetical protein